MIRSSICLLLCLALSSVEVFSAPTDDNSPEATLQRAFAAIAEHDFTSENVAPLLVFFAEDAFISRGSSAAEIQTLTIVELLDLARNELNRQGIDRLLITPVKTDCRRQGEVAQCTLALQTSFPGISAKAVASTASYNLRKVDNNWLIHSGTTFIDIPDTPAGESVEYVASYPILWEEFLPGKPAQWDRALPFWAQKVVDLGYDLPNPYGVAVVPVFIRQDMVISDLEVGVNGGPLEPIDFVQFGTGRVENTTAQLKFDAWIFPFLNAFVAIGKVDGDVEMPLQIGAEGLLDGLDPSICSGLFRPQICDEQVHVLADLSYEGETLTVGINVAGGWKQFFFTLPASYTWSDIDLIDSTVEAINISPRIGVTSGATEWGVISTFIGGTYLDADVDVTGSVEVRGLVPGDETTVIDFKVNQRNKDHWNYLVGFNWDIDKNWSVHAEGGFGGSRDNFIASATYRF